MFKRALIICFPLVVSLGLALFHPAYVEGQGNPQCPTRPVGDSTNACASTAFVNNTLSAGGIPLPHTHLFIGNGSNFATDFGSLITASDNGTLAVSPNIGTNAAINVSQNTGTTGSITGPFALNLWNISDSVLVNGTGNDFTGNNVAGTAGFRVNTQFSGSNLAGTSGTLISGLFTSTLNSTANIVDVTGLAGTGYTTLAMSGGGFLEGVNGVGHVGNGGSANVLAGGDFDARVDTGGTANYRVGVSIGSNGNVSATTLDTAISIDTPSTAGTVSWNKVISFTTFGGAGSPLAQAADIFYNDAPRTIANFTNLSNMTVTGNVLSFPFVTLTGPGQLTLGASSPLPTSSDIKTRITSTLGGLVDLYSSANSATGFDGVDINSSPGTGFNQLTNGVWEASNAGAVVFGLARANRAVVASQGSTNNGLLIGTLSGTTLTLGTNNVARITVLSSGNIGVGTETNPQSKFVVNENTATGVTAGQGDLVSWIGSDGVQPINSFYGFGNGFFNGAFSFKFARGTAASPLGVNAGDFLGVFGFGGWNPVASAYAPNKARVIGIATDTYSSTVQGTALEVDTTATGGTTRIQAARIGAGIHVGALTGVDPGAGVVNLSPQAFSTLASCTNTLRGSIAAVSDSNTVTWGNNVAGGSTNEIIAHCNGTAWTVMGK